ncbi:hypothetical protein J3R82DRAFT_7155 [Butyriboletus roseoflavus]|nr:hypothetical protein J3R82DRAFT_7155 [Butyriboletus roseoflavus]
MPTKKSKRPRLARDGQTEPSTTLASARATLTGLPIEILAEVLLYTCSPPTVVAVSRTCSFLYHSLAQNPAASFIWRGVRETCKPVLPDPGKCWKGSEADYAAFVFGGGVCEVCRKTTRAMYVSFAARIRLCGSWYCRRKLLSESLVNLKTMSAEPYRQAFWVPFVESNLCFYPSAYRASTWPYNNAFLLRKTDWEKYQLDFVAYEAAEETRAERKRALAADSLSAVREEAEQRKRYLAIQSFPGIMELSARLIRWRCDYDKEYKNIKKQNQIWTKTLAEHEGWDLDDLVASQTFGSLQRRKTFLLEKIGLDDVSPIWSAIESELLAVQVRHKHQKAEATYKLKLTEVKKIYERMRCGTLNGAKTGTAGPSDPTGALILPPLSVFCTLPSVRVLKGSPDPSTVPPSTTSATIDIKSSPLATSLIISDLHTWIVPVRKHLMNLLGYPNGWQSASTRILPPLHRVTARFFCQRCGEGRVGRAYQREQCLDLGGVCSHVCVAAQGKSIEGLRQEGPQEGMTDATDAGDGNRQEMGKSRGKKKTLDWKVDVFEKDKKAIRLIKTILELTALSEEDLSTASSLTANDRVIRCLTCKGWIVMDFDTAASPCF